MHSPSANNRGVTLVELVVASAIGLVVLGALSSTFILQQRRYDVQAQITIASQTARASLDMMSRELMMAGYDPRRTGLSGVVDCNGTQVEIKADLNGNGSTAPSGTPNVNPNEEITYAYNSVNQRITRKTGGGDPMPFAENITAFNVSCFDNDGNEVSSSPAVRQLQILVTARSERPDPSTGDYHSVTLTSEVKARNLGLDPGTS